MSTDNKTEKTGTQPACPFDYIDLIDQYLVPDLASAPEEKQRPRAILIGPPGSGKSVFVDVLRQYVERHGRVTPSRIVTPDSDQT